MNISVYVWDTIHDQANKTMTHIFENGVNAVINWEQRTLTLECRKKIVDVFPIDGQSYSINEHTETLVKIACIAHAKHFFGRYTRRRNLKKIRHELLSL